jgi:hypothetical protein
MESNTLATVNGDEIARASQRLPNPETATEQRMYEHVVDVNGKPCTVAFERLRIKNARYRSSYWIWSATSAVRVD